MCAHGRCACDAVWGVSGRFSPEVMGGMGRLWHAPSGRAVAGRGSLTKQQLETSLRAVRGGPGGGGRECAPGEAGGGCVEVVLGGPWRWSWGAEALLTLPQWSYLPASLLGLVSKIPWKGIKAGRSWGVMVTWTR